MAVVVQSKFNLRRICVATKATPLVRIGKPMPEVPSIVKSLFSLPHFNYRNLETASRST